MMEIPGTTCETLLAWVKGSIRDNTGILSAGYQGKVFLYRCDTHSYVIKAPPNVGLLRWLFILMLRHEYRVYQKLTGLEGVPVCYGLLAGQYLILEYIDGKTLREVNPQNKKQYYSDFVQVILKMHALGVAHSDLKRKENILVSADDKPFLVDYGAAIVLKKGFAPLNRYLFYLAKRFDLNAWVKHKYAKDLSLVSDEDKRLYKRTLIEKLSKVIKRSYLRMKYIFVRK